MRIRFNAKCERITVRDGITEVLFTSQDLPKATILDEPNICVQGEQYIIDVRPTSRKRRKVKGETVNVPE